ncbi:MAG: ankyrin repeat domain-containing protein [Candidatus Hydrogenedentes bacterium]|nr:ankyrin repeat domain-containing protein [Candidatus Hydrogenedentota bacterium]
MSVFQAASDPAAADMLEAILASGSDPNVKDDSGLTPLHYAVLADNGPAVRILLGASADPEITDSEGWTPRDVAEEQEKLSALQAFDRFEKLR